VVCAAVLEGESVIFGAHLTVGGELEAGRDPGKAVS